MRPVFSFVFRENRVPYYQRLFQNHDGKRQWWKVSFRDQAPFGSTIGSILTYYLLPPDPPFRLRHVPLPDLRLRPRCWLVILLQLDNLAGSLLTLILATTYAMCRMVFVSQSLVFPPTNLH